MRTSKKGGLARRNGEDNDPFYKVRGDITPRGRINRGQDLHIPCSSGGSVPTVVTPVPLRKATATAAVPHELITSEFFLRVVQIAPRVHTLTLTSNLNPISLLKEKGFR